MNHRLFALSLATLLAVSVLAFARAQDATPTPDDLAATVGAHETRISALETQVATLVTPLVEATPIIPVATPIAGGTLAIPGSDVPMVTGPARDVVPAGVAGEVAVAGYSPVANDGEFVVVIRNGLNQPVSRVAVSGVFRDPAGQILAIAESVRPYPFSVRPGEPALVLMTVEGTAPDPTQATLEFSVSYQEGMDDIGVYVDLIIVEAQVVDGQLLGLVRNPTEGNASGGSVLVGCFDGAGAMTGHARSYISVSTLSAGATSAFAVELPPSGCDHYLVAAVA